MVDDLVTFGVLFLVVTVAFSSGLAGLQRTTYAAPDYRGDMTTLHGGFLAPVWAVFGTVDIPEWGGATAWVLWTYSLT
eukprot:4347185-Prymnesium_polylepis.1